MMLGSTEDCGSREDGCTMETHVGGVSVGVARDIPMMGHIQTLEQSKCYLGSDKGDIISMAHPGR